MTASSTTFTSAATPFSSSSPYDYPKSDPPKPGEAPPKFFRPDPTEKDLDETARRLGMPGVEEGMRKIYMDALKGIHDAAQFTLSQPDYIPHTDMPTYPRTNIHFPSSHTELELGWAWKATVRKEPPVEFVEEDQVDSHEEQAILNMVFKEGERDMGDGEGAGKSSGKNGEGKTTKPSTNSGSGNAKPLHSGTHTPQRQTTRRPAKLAGKSLALKDMIMLHDVPTLFGSEVLSSGEYLSQMDATCVTRILDEGGVIRGKANCESWARHWISSTAPRSVIQNPYAKGFSAGGSSSGCAALLVAGEVDMAVGGDQSGSIRIPASACGIVGLRPTYGLVPSTGVISHEAEKEVIGPMTTTVYDCALLLEVIAGPDWIDLRMADRPMPNPLPKYTQLLQSAREKAAKDHPSQSLKGRRIGVLKEGFTVPGSDDRVLEVVKDAVEGFKKLGAEVKEVSCPSHVTLSGANSIATVMSGTAPFVGRSVGSKHLRLGAFWGDVLPWTPEKWEKLEPMLKLEIISAEYVAKNFPSAFDNASNLVRKLSADIDAMFDEVDVLVMPTSCKPPPRHVPKNKGLEGILNAGRAMSANTNPYSASGHPCLSLPVGFTPASAGDIFKEEDRHIRLPVGMQLVAAKYNEAELFIVGDAWEKAYAKGDKEKFGLDRVDVPIDQQDPEDVKKEQKGEEKK